ncbi:MAG: AAA family ATPase [Leptospiraceae bacterium]|nr:AAA family ATPase [Leptospiraceae bacterium]MCP5511079.1 AAA family ATPase [Leptospiraceae bacterium]
MVRKNKKANKANIISIANQKGGEGKTSISLFLSEALSEKDKVLLVDWDAQANATRFFFNSVKKNIFDCLGYRGAKTIPTSDVILKITDNLDLLPSSIALANFTTPFGVEDFSLLKDCLIQVQEEYSYILIDCSPSLGLGLENALIASDFVLVPIQTRAFSVQGIGDLYSTVDKIKKKANPSLFLLGAVFNQYEETRSLTGLAQGVKKYFPVFDTFIPRREGIPQAQVKRKMLKDCDDKIRKPFYQLANEVRERIDVQKK